MPPNSNPPGFTDERVIEAIARNLVDLMNEADPDNTAGRVWTQYINDALRIHDLSSPSGADGWRPIETAPECGWRDAPKDCLLYIHDWGGVRQGRAGRYPDGRVHSDVPNVNGDIGATHWQPLPAPPPPSSSEDGR